MRINGERAATVLVIAWVAGSLSGCMSSQDASDMNTSENEGVTAMAVEPAGPVEVGFSDTIQFAVQLLDSAGEPVSGVPVDVAFLDPSQNATLSPARFFTDEAGQGTVLFTAPSPTGDDKTSFDIRFRSPDSEQRVSVTVDPALVSVAVTVDYDGNRDISSLEVVLFLLDAEDASRTEKATLETKAILPTVVTFSGLLRDQLYEVEVNGRNTEDEIRAAGRLTDLEPNTADLSLHLTDTRLDLVGQYEARADIVTDGALDGTTDALLGAAVVIDHPAVAVLDGIEDALSEDPFAVESFATQRESLSLDAVLAEHYEDIGTDTAGAFDAVREEMVGALAHIVAGGAVESAQDVSETYNAYHSVSKLTFGADADSVVSVFPLSPVSTAECAAAYLDNDTLSLSSHDIAVGLGDPLFFLYADVCFDVFGTSDTARVLQSLLDCEETATFLEPYLADVTVLSVIEQGCLGSFQTATESMEKAVTALNQTNRLTFGDGVFVLEIPDVGSGIPGFSTENLTVTWHVNGEAGASMSATFTAGEVDQK